MGKVLSMSFLIEVDAGDGVMTRYEVRGLPGTIYNRKVHIDVEPIYGNPGEPATQVRVAIDAMLIPDGNYQLVSITEHPLPGENELPEGSRSIRLNAPVSEVFWILEAANKPVPGDGA